MKNERGNLIIGDFVNKDRKSIAVQSLEDKPLKLELSPKMIYECFLSDSDISMTSCKSMMDPKKMDVSNKYFVAKGNNYACLFHADWIEGDETDDVGERAMEAHMLEIKIGKVFIFAEFGTTPATEYNQTYQEGMKLRAENAFIALAGLIGIRVSRGLVWEK